MGTLAFFASVLASCLLWSAACVAAAARVRRVWLARLLVTIAWVVPIAALVPWVLVTGFLGFSLRLETNWFGPVFTTTVAALIGCVWVCVAGSSRPSGEDRAGVRGADWPMIGLVALFLAAKGVAIGILLILENAVAAQAPYLRIEAASLIEANLPPVVTDDENAAPLYLAAFRGMEADAGLTAADSEIAKGNAADISAEATREAVRRHRDTLDLLRRAADREVCRFTRDWQRPSFEMLLPELQSMRSTARLLAVAARIEASEGRPEAALRDVARIARMGRHAASEPIVISGLVGLALDALSRETLVRVLPAVDAESIGGVDHSALSAPPPSITHCFFGEEAFGLATFADLADGRTRGGSGLLPWAVLRESNASEPPEGPGWFAKPLELVYRVFLLPADLAGYRRGMHEQQRIAAQPRPLSTLNRDVAALEASFEGRRPGLLTSLILPALGAVQRNAFKAEARRAAADVLVAATRQRIATGSLPTAVEGIEPKWLPVAPPDPLSGKTLIDRGPLRSAMREDGLAIWSVGLDGEDDGGPPPAGANAVDGNDDVGLVLPNRPG